ncbi:MAG: DUF5723 family protein [Odoribacter sp.]
MKHILLIVLTILSVISNAKAQDGNNTSYFLLNLPQQYRLNPAYQPEYKVFIGLPGMSGISINYLNSSFTPVDLLDKRDDSVYMDINKFYKSLRKRNYISLNNENSIFSIGVRAKSWYGTLDITQKNDFLFRYNKDIFTFLKEGNADHPNMDFGKLGVNVNSYLEVALGLSKQVNKKLTVGGRIKYLSGIANVNMTDSDLSVSTDENGAVNMHSRQNIRVSSPILITDKSGQPFPLNQPIDWDEFDMDTDDLDVSSFLHTKNPGFAIDLGGEYKFNEKINLFASLTDLGFIHWGNTEFNYVFHQNTSFKWEGADISNSINKEGDGSYISVDSAFTQLTDSLKNNFRLSNKGGAYNTMLSPKLSLGATYRLNNTFNVGGLFRASLVNGMFLPSLTASANARLLRNVSASVSYTITRGSYVNLGAGLTAKLGPIQLYLVTDNVLAANYTNTQSASARFGINLLFGHKDHKRKVKKQEETSIEIVIAPVPVKRDTVKKDITPEIDPVVPMKEEKVTDVGGNKVKSYYVIAGSFKSKQRAENFQKKLIFMGFKESSILINEQGMYRVTTTALDNHTACWDEVFRIRKKHPQFNDVWGLTVRA